MSTYGMVMLCVVLVLAVPALLLLVYYSWRNGISPMPTSAKVRSMVSRQVKIAAEQVMRLRQESIITLEQTPQQGLQKLQELQELQGLQKLQELHELQERQELQEFQHLPQSAIVTKPHETASHTNQQASKLAHSVHVIEAGSGWGTLALQIIQDNPTVRITGIENSPLPLFVARLLAKLKRTAIHFQQGDLYHYPYEQADIIVCYLFPGAMSRLSSILEQQCRAHTYVISVYFALPDWEPEQVIVCSDGYRTPVYVYRCGHRSYLA